MASRAQGTLVSCEACGKRNRVPWDRAGIPRCGACSAPLPWLSDATDETFEQVAEAATIPVLVDMWAPWCGPCKWVTPVLERLAKKLAGRVKLVKVNVDESPRIAQRYEVRGVPTFLVLDHGETIDRRTGAAPEPELREWLERSLDRLDELDRRVSSG